MNFGGAVPRRICYRTSSNAVLRPQNSPSAALLKPFSSVPLLRNELPTDQLATQSTPTSSSADSPPPTPSPSASSAEESSSNPFPPVPASIKGRTIVGTVSHIHTNTARVEHNEQVWDKRLQKHFKKTAHNLVHDPTSLLRVGDVVRYSPFTPDEKAAREKHRNKILEYEEAKGVDTGRGQSVTRKGFVVPDGKRLVMVGAKLEAIPKRQRNSKGMRFVAREVVSPFGSSVAQRLGSMKKAGWLQDLQKRGFHSYSAARMAAIHAASSADADVAADAADAAETKADASAGTHVDVVQRDFRDRLNNAKSAEERSQIFLEILEEHKRHVAEESAKHGQNFVYERLYMANTLVAGIVGAKWSIRDRLQGESGATIRPAKPVPTSSRFQLKQFDVYGSKEAVDKAKELIRSRLEKEVEKIKYAGNWAGKDNVPVRKPRSKLGRSAKTVASRARREDTEKAKAGDHQAESAAAGTVVA